METGRSQSIIEPTSRHLLSYETKAEGSVDLASMPHDCVQRWTILRPSTFDYFMRRLLIGSHTRSPL